MSDLPSIFPSIRVFSNESALCIRWPKYWSFSFNISLSNGHPGPISFRMDWLDLLAVQGTHKGLLQHHSNKLDYIAHYYNHFLKFILNSFCPSRPLYSTFLVWSDPRFNLTLPISDLFPVEHDWRKMYNCIDLFLFKLITTNFNWALLVVTNPIIFSRFTMFLEVKRHSFSSYNKFLTPLPDIFVISLWSCLLLHWEIEAEEKWCRLSSIALPSVNICHYGWTVHVAIQGQTLSVYMRSHSLLPIQRNYSDIYSSFPYHQYFPLLYQFYQHVSMPFFFFHKKWNLFSFISPSIYASLLSTQLAKLLERVIYALWSRIAPTTSSKLLIKVTVAFEFLNIIK